MMDEVEFYVANEDGGVKVRTLSQADIMACPHTIMVPEHFRDDGSCLCDDPEAKIMRQWGYRWNPMTGRWEA